MSSSEDVGGALDVHRRDITCGVSIAGERGFHQGEVFGVHIAGDRAVGERHAAIALRAEILMECGRRGLVGGQDDQIIQIASTLATAS